MRKRLTAKDLSDPETALFRVGDTVQEKDNLQTMTIIRVVSVNDVNPGFDLFECEYTDEHGLKQLKHVAAENLIKV